MARLARLVVPGLPHHITQRGNRRERVFFEDDDYRAYLALTAGAARKSGTGIWAYCLMPNPVHFIMTPSSVYGLRQTFAEAHWQHTVRINTRFGQTGHLWQGRFSSVVMDEPHFMAAARYVPMNPVRAGLTARAADWPWSSVHAHLAGRDDGVVTVAPILDRAHDFAAFLGEDADQPAIDALRLAKSTGRPVGSADWIARLEADTRRALAPEKRGPKPRAPPIGGEGELFKTLSP
jgi:putative transposase